MSARTRSNVAILATLAQHAAGLRFNDLRGMTATAGLRLSVSRNSYSICESPLDDEVMFAAATPANLASGEAFVAALLGSVRICGDDRHSRPCDGDCSACKDECNGTTRTLTPAEIDSLVDDEENGADETGCLFSDCGLAVCHRCFPRADCVDPHHGRCLDLAHAAGRFVSVVIVSGFRDFKNGYREPKSIVGPFDDRDAAITFARAHPDVVQECGRSIGCCFLILPLVLPSA